MLNRLLIIDSAEHSHDLVKYCIARTWPDARVELYDPVTGIPGAEFDWDTYDLILLEYDLGIDGQDGLEWLRLIRLHHQNLPIVMLTAFGSESVAVKAIKLGADYYFNVDDLSPKQFTEQVSKIINQHEISKTQRIPAPLANRLERTQDLTEQTDESAKRDHRHTQGRASGDDSGARNRRRASTTNPPSARAGNSSKTNQVTIRVPGYEVLRQVGKGGMATIYLAKRDEDGLELVLKIVHLHDWENTEPLKRFMQEYQLLSKLKHPNVVQIYERAFASDFAYIAMEWFPDGDLKARIKKTIEPDKIAPYLRQMAKGLSAVHDIGIVHRDIKPANVLFKQGDKLAISDFGIAKDVSENQGLTVRGSLIGSLYYASPEQISGEAVDSRSDIYSLGTILFQMLTGSPPFRAKTPVELINAHQSAPIPRLSPEHAQWQPVLDGLMAKDPDDRFQSVDELLMGLEW